MLANIQVLRCAAALAVLWHHVLVQLNIHMGAPMLIDAGRAGVDVFFVISGFIMFHTTRDGDRTTLGFWRDRVIRIVPLYWLITAVVIALFAFGLKPSGTRLIDAADISHSLAFLPYIASNGDWNPIVDPGWTLVYEMYFYFLFGLTFFLRSQVKSLVLLVAVFAAGWLLTRYAGPLPHELEYYFQPLVFEFAAGALLALLYRRKVTIPRVTGRVIGYGLALVGAAGLILAEALFSRQINDSMGARAVVFGIPATAIVAGALILERVGVVSKSRSVLFLGAASYSIYLCHDQVVDYTLRMLDGFNLPHTAPFQILTGVILGVVGLGAGSALYLGFEKPATVFLKSRFGGRRRRAVPAAAATAAE